jgi:hypothetical protein
LDPLLIKILKKKRKLVSQFQSHKALVCSLFSLKHGHLIPFRKGNMASPGSRGEGLVFRDSERQEQAQS